MLILAHRAQDVKEPIPQRFGVEIDVRDYEGEICASHDMMDDPWTAKPLWRWLELDLSKGTRPKYALNIKADGMHSKLELLFRDEYPDLSNHSFVFDGSYPTMRRLKSLNVPVAERISEEEPYRGFSDIIWLDRWDWMDGEGAVSPGYPVASGENKCCRVPLMNYKTGNTTTVYAVSPELHLPNCPPGYRQFWWRRFQEMGCAGICTDYWLEAEEFLR